MYQPMPALIGHRGLPTLAPENTAASIRLAAENQIDWVEIDVTMAGDGSLVIMHDNHLKLFGQPNRYLKDLTESDLRQVDAGSWFSDQYINEPLLFLPELLALVNTYNLGLNLEIKINPDLDVARQVTAIYDVLAEQNLPIQHLLVSSFHHDALRVLRACSSVVQIGLLFEELPDALLTEARDLQPTTIHCEQGRLTKDQARNIVPHYPLYCYTVNDADTLSKLLNWGVSGVFCDRAQASDLRAVVNNHQA